jgi:anti-anti-sigma factor
MFSCSKEKSMIPDLDVLRPKVGVAVVELHGEHDIATKTEVRELFTSLVEANDLVVVDVTNARFIDASILNNLAEADRLSRNRGSRLRLQLGTASIVRKALEISGLLEHLDCATDRKQAIT